MAARSLKRTLADLVASSLTDDDGVEVGPFASLGVAADRWGSRQRLALLYDAHSSSVIQSAITPTVASWGVAPGSRYPNEQAPGFALGFCSHLQQSC